MDKVQESQHLPVGGAVGGARGRTRGRGVRRRTRGGGVGLEPGSPVGLEMGSAVGSVFLFILNLLTEADRTTAFIGDVLFARLLKSKMSASVKINVVVNMSRMIVSLVSSFKYTRASVLHVSRGHGKAAPSFLVPTETWLDWLPQSRLV